jgi:hypothetical protein
MVRRINALLWETSNEGKTTNLALNYNGWEYMFMRMFVFLQKVLKMTGRGR